MSSLPTIVIDGKEYSFKVENTEILFQKAFGAGSMEAAILAQLYAMAVTHKVNLKTLVPVMEGLIELWRTDTPGQVTVHFGKGKDGRRYYNVDLLRTLNTRKKLS